VNTFAQGHYKDSARQAGFAARKAEDTKRQKYHDLRGNYHFQPVAIEITGVYGKLIAPLSGLAKKLVDVSGGHQSETLKQTLGAAHFIIVVKRRHQNYVTTNLQCR